MLDSESSARNSLPDRARPAARVVSLPPSVRRVAAPRARAQGSPERPLSFDRRAGLGGWRTPSMHLGGGPPHGRRRGPRPGCRFDRIARKRRSRQAVGRSRSLNGSTRYRPNTSSQMLACALAGPAWGWRSVATTRSSRGWIAPNGLRTTGASSIAEADVRVTGDGAACRRLAVVLGDVRLSRELAETGHAARRQLAGDRRACRERASERPPRRLGDDAAAVDFFTRAGQLGRERGQALRGRQSDSSR